ncbi:MAG TPA: hypothetical protein DCS24_02395 [Erythrobacter sp.]|nr:hypothetical protein [Erythrobacter sp.]
MQKVMRRLAKWHIWLGWIVGLPILMWMVTGLFMASKPIEEVRGNHLRKEISAQPLVLPNSEIAALDGQLREMRAMMQDGRPVAILTTLDGLTFRVDMESGEIIPSVDAEMARAIVAERIVGGDNVSTVTSFEANQVPFDFRRPMPVWQVTLQDGANIYVGRDTGEIEAVRTHWWRWFDFMWGLHILDPQDREDTSHPVLIIFAALGTIGALFGVILMFRRRKARAKA